MSRLLVVKALIFIVIVPGTVTVLVPHLLLRPSEMSLPAAWWSYLGVAPILAGASVALRSMWDFLTVGKGTPAPIDPPKELVATGFYRYVRNPMYVGVVLVLIGEGVLFDSVDLLGYAVVFALLAHLFVVFYEEPALRRTFGDSYVRYCRSVRRWIPRMPKEAPR